MSWDTSLLAETLLGLQNVELLEEAGLKDSSAHVDSMIIPLLKALRAFWHLA